MSLDYPFYQELRKRRHPAAKWWIVGDRLYYIGLLGCVVSFFLIPFFRWRAAGGLGLAWAVFFVGARCKYRSWVMGARDGINVNDF